MSNETAGCYSVYFLQTGIVANFYKTMTDKLMYILNDDTQNYPFYKLQLVVETFRLNSINQPIKIR